jgi:hypothetical protein
MTHHRKAIALTLSLATLLLSAPMRGGAEKNRPGRPHPRANPRREKNLHRQRRRGRIPL